MALDGLRGLAALVVLFYHVELFFTRTSFIGHGYLGVDFFFMLSGFVIGASYEERLADRSMRGWEFTKTRFVRLYPLVLAGTVISAAFAIFHLPANGGFSAKMIIEELLFVPAWRTGGGVYPLLNTQWSLGLELVANLAHYWLLRRMKIPALATIATLCGIALIVLAVRHGQADMGNGIGTLGGGFARLGFSYTAGLIIFRLHKAGKISGTPGGWWKGSILFLLAVSSRWMFVPSAVFQDMFAIFLVFPLIVCGALKPIGHPLVNRWAERAAELSFPLYILQSPFQDAARQLLKPYDAVTQLEGGLAYAAGIIAISWFILRLYDEPIRKALRHRLGLTKPSVAYTAP